MTFDPRFFMQLLFQSSVTVDNKLYLHSSEVKTGFCGHMIKKPSIIHFISAISDGD